jgi:putative Mg2+ transporter-C (MgtC) family protein
MENFIKLGIAAVLGGIIGIEREIQGQTAGFRTQLLVCLGACLFTIISIYAPQLAGNYSDPGRIAAQIVVGIGFLGAGAILKHGNHIRGLTTAASLWIVSAIGMAVGFGKYSLAVATSVIVLASLIVLKYMEHRMPKDCYVRMRIKTDSTEDLFLEPLMKDYGLKIMERKIKIAKADSFIEQELSIQYKNYERLKSFIDEIGQRDNILEISVF